MVSPNLLRYCHDADPNAASANVESAPEFGMPLHMAVCDQRFELANLLLDSGASANAYPNCDKAAVEQAFYLAQAAGLEENVCRPFYAKYLPEREQAESQSTLSLVRPDAPEAIQLFARLMELGGQPPFTAIVRGGFLDLVKEIVVTSRDEPGTPHDHPNSTVFNNVFGAARWYGYPKLVKWFMEQFPTEFTSDLAMGTTGVAIGSHNRDGSYADYREIIVAQLERIDELGELEMARRNPDFKPLFHMATDFTWHDNYGYRAEIAEPECYVDLAELFVSYGFNDIEYRDPKSDHSPLSAATKRGHHPGIGTYIEWLLDKGADLRLSAPDDVNPIALAKEKGFDEILQLLESRR
ncbi:MAG: hypothetical protein AB8G99_01815 [Planctomycetaceae bacterium]